MSSVARSVFVVCASLLFATAVWAQPAQQAVLSSTNVDRVFQINGVYRPTDGKTAAAVETVTFSIYAEATGGTPLWQETQNLAVDSQGRYSVLLGSTTDGLPVDLFASGEPRWLGTQFLRTGEPEQPRTLATSVPYAMKAAKASDADTLGGLPASAFVRSDAAGSGSSGGAAVGNPIGADRPLTAGTIGRIGKFTTGADLGNSVMFESSGRIGLGTTTPVDFMHTQFTDTTGAFTGYAVRNLGATATSFSGMLFYDHLGALGLFQGFNNVTKEYRINNVAPGGSINFLQGSASRFLVDEAGNIGVGQPDPNFKLDILHGGSTGIRVKSTGSFSTIDIDGASGDSALRFANNGTNQWNLRNRPGDNFLEIFELGGGGSRVLIEDTTGRMILNSDTGGATERLTVQGNVRIGTGTNGCVMDADGTVIAGSCSSDRRFKKDITPFLPTLERFVGLQPVHYFWRASEFADKRFGTKQSYGLIAQDVQEVFPDLVTTDEKGYLAVNYSKLPLLTIQAVKELKAENDALKAQNAALEARLSALEAAVKARPQQ